MRGSIVLFYHSVAPVREPDPLASFARSVRVDAELFRDHMQLVARRFSIVPLDELCAQLRGGFVRRGQACVTFDDGYADNYEHAFPVLRRLGIPATIFLTTDAMEDGRSFWWERLATQLNRRVGARLLLPPELGGTTVDLASPVARIAAYDDLVRRLQVMDSASRDDCLGALGAPQPPHARPLTWDQAAAMQRAGIAFGAHSHTHPSLTALTDAALREEIATSRDQLARRLDRAPSLFAYPFGEVSARVALAVEDAGFAGAVTTQPVMCAGTASPYAMPRLPVGNWDTRTLAARLDKVTNTGAGNKAATLLKQILPAPVVDMGRKMRAGWTGRF